MADARNICSDYYTNIKQYIGNIDILFLSIEPLGVPASWIYGNLFRTRLDPSANESRLGRSNDVKEALQLVKMFECKEVYLYAMGLEQWLKYIIDIENESESQSVIYAKQFIYMCKEQGVYAEALHNKRLINAN